MPPLNNENSAQSKETQQDAPQMQQPPQAQTVLANNSSVLSQVPQASQPEASHTSTITAPVMPTPSTPEPVNQTMTQADITAVQPAQKKSYVMLMIVVVSVFLLGGGATYAFIAQLGPFGKAPYDTTMLATELYSGVQKIHSAEYTLKLETRSEPKEPDAEPFNQALASNPETTAKYNKDIDKMRDIQSALSWLSVLAGQKKPYPEKFPAEAGPAIASLEYSASNAGQSFTLTTMLESAEAISYLKKNTASEKNSGITITDKRLTITDQIYKSDAYYYLRLPPEPPQPAFASILSSPEMLESFSSNLNLLLEVNAASQKTGEDEKDINGKLRIAGKLTAGSLNIEVDSEFRKIGKTFYALLTKAPTLFFDFSKISGKWIKITENDMSSLNTIGFVPTNPSATQKDVTDNRERGVEAIKLFLDIAEKHKAITSKGTPEKERLGNIPAYKYTIEFNKETLPDFYNELTTEFKKKFEEENPIEFDESTLEYLKSKEFEEVFAYFRKNTTLYVWADKDGLPLQVEYRLRFVPQTKTASDKQVRSIVTLALSNINGTIVIDEPKDTLSVEDATILMTGKTKEEYTRGKQLSGLETLRYAIDRYKRIVGETPSTLSDLEKTYGELITKSAKKENEELKYYTSSGMESMKLVETLPKDAYTNEPYTYTKTGSSTYTLTYTMKNPPYVQGESIYGLYTYTDEATTKNSKPKITLTYIDGINTMTSTSTSLEAAKASIQDTDADGVSDIFERYIGTDIAKKDTDGDGYSDSEEITRSSNPLGPGNLKGGY